MIYLVTNQILQGSVRFYYSFSLNGSVMQYHDSFWDSLSEITLPFRITLLKVWVDKEFDNVGNK